MNITFRLLVGAVLLIGSAIYLWRHEWNVDGYEVFGIILLVLGYLITTDELFGPFPLY